MSTVIALCGPIGVGKDVVGYYLRRNHNYVRVGLADQLKHLVSKKLDVDSRAWDNRTFKNANRHHLINDAMTMRDWDINYWINASGIEYLLMNGKNIVITDLRFVSELVKLDSLTANFGYNFRPVYLNCFDVESKKHLDADWKAYDKRLSDKNTFEKHHLIQPADIRSYATGSIYHFPRLEKDDIDTFLNNTFFTAINEAQGAYN